MRQALLGVAGVDTQQKVRRRQTVEDKVIDKTTALVEHSSILSLSVLQSFNIVDGQTL